ncbi:hypothetical protein ACLKA7_001786 [Drosophila subpalustris]
MWISVSYVDKCFICVVHAVAANLLTTGHGPKFSDRELEIPVNWIFAGSSIAFRTANPGMQSGPGALLVFIVMAEAMISL